MADGKITAYQINRLGPGRRGVLTETGKVLDVLKDDRDYPFLEIAGVTGLPIGVLTKIIRDMSESGQVKLLGKLEDVNALVISLK